MTTEGLGYLWMAATEEATISLPSWLWISALMFRPVLMPGPTTMGLHPIKRPTAAVIVAVREGTTLERIAPSTEPISAP